MVSDSPSALPTPNAARSSASCNLCPLPVFCGKGPLTPHLTPPLASMNDLCRSQIKIFQRWTRGNSLSFFSNKHSRLPLLDLSSPAVCNRGSLGAPWITRGRVQAVSRVFFFDCRSRFFVGLEASSPCLFFERDYIGLPWVKFTPPPPPPSIDNGLFSRIASS